MRGGYGAGGGDAGGGVQLRPEGGTSSPTSITVAATVYRQGVEDIATAHCARQGLIPRLTQQAVYVPPDHNVSDTAP